MCDGEKSVPVLDLRTIDVYVICEHKQQLSFCCGDVHKNNELVSALTIS